jgi:hypothetical protein
MRAIFVAVLAATVGLAPLKAGAKEFDLATLTCKAFAASAEDDQFTVMVWLDGYETEENNPKIVDPEELEEDTATLNAYCAKHPSAMLMDAVEEAFD